ncbi:MAG: rod shape-determining protein MreC [bacterium]|nr:rod shape-determining protein MreC [bacterium]
MTSRKRIKRLGPRLGRGKPLVVPALFFLILIFLAAVLWRSQATGLFWQAAAPLLALRNGFATSPTAQLNAELAATKAMRADRNVLYQENLQLKARLGRDGSVQTILAGVLMRPPATPYDTLMIDAGSQQGVTENDLVSAGGTVLIGRVAQVYGATARVVLFSAPGQTYNALLSIQNGASSVPVEVQGQGAGSLEAQVPAKTAVAVGDAVLFPGIAGGFSSVVSHIDVKDGESFETLYMHLPVDPLTLRYVEVWRQKNAAQ